MEEIWKAIPEFEYEVSTLGRVRSKNRIITDSRGKLFSKKGKILSPCDDSNGYLFVNLFNHNKAHKKKVHRLVAEVFIPNPSYCRDVNHIDENTKNNCVNNLEWLTHKENLNYGTRNQRVSEIKSKRVYQFTKEGILVTSYKNTYVAGKALNIFPQNIASCCKNNKGTSGGFIWRYTNIL